jgi:protein-S-isoprenylcysteine O-methyltransferase Ste14
LVPDSPLHWILAATSAATVAFFCIGLTSYFERRSDRPGWVRLLHDTGALLALIQLVGVVLFEPRSDWLVFAGLALYLGAMLVFLSAIETARSMRMQRSFVDHPLPERLLTDGPFAWVRHPFYAGYMMGAVAPCVAIDHPALVVVALPMIAMVLNAAFREERIWLSSPRAEAYRQYQQRTGMFVPWLHRRLPRASHV